MARCESRDYTNLQAVSALGAMLRATDAMNEMAWRGLHTRRPRRDRPAANGLSPSAEVRNTIGDNTS
jgi:hypothetical protein